MTSLISFLVPTHLSLRKVRPYYGYESKHATLMFCRIFALILLSISRELCIHFLFILYNTLLEKECTCNFPDEVNVLKSKISFKNLICFS